MRAIRVCCAVFVVVALTGCGSEKKDKKLSGPAEQPTETTVDSKPAKATTTTVPKPAVDRTADLATAKAAVLAAADLPGFTGTAHDTTDSQFPEAASLEFSKCMGVDESLFDDDSDAQRANSPDFAQGDISVQSEVEVYADPADVAELFEQLTLEQAPDCLGRLFDAALKEEPIEGATVGTPNIEAINLDGLGQDVAGFRVALPITGNGQATTFYVDIIAIKQDRAVATLSTFSGSAPPDQTLERSLGELMVSRIGDNAK